MVKVQIDLNEKLNTKVRIVMVRLGLKSKAETIKTIIDWVTK